MGSNLDQINVQDLLDEQELDQIEDKDFLIISFLQMKGSACMTEPQKDFFLLFAEDHKILPFEFKKHHHGPFSRELETELNTLEGNGTVEIKEERLRNMRGNAYTLKTIKLTDAGKRQARNNKDTVTKISNKIQKTVKKYSDYNATALEGHCYREYFLKPKGVKKVVWETERKGKVDELKLRNTALIQQISIMGVDEDKKTLICTSLDYIEKLVSNTVLFNMDEVISGVVLNNIERYLENWSAILILSKGENHNNDIKRLMKENNKIFMFLNDTAKKYEIMDSIFDETPCIN